MQSALDPHGAQARTIAHLFWGFVAVCSAVWVLVLIALGIALWRRRPARTDPLSVDSSAERRSLRAIGVCVTATALVMIIFTVTSFFSQRILLASPGASLEVKVRGHQWWWEVQYRDPQAGGVFTTANEIHIPVGQFVSILLDSDDVIHSFWVPSLTGKIDQIPGHENELQLIADRPGIYRGQCAEFCGQQHAKMGFLIIASPPDEFAAWADAQRHSAVSAPEPERQDGDRVFIGRGCALCHTIAGTGAGGVLGPDLTHVASRRTLAAGTVPLNPGNLASWIADPQHIKPGAQMPAMPLSGQDLSHLVAYLMGLK